MPKKPLLVQTNLPPPPLHPPNLVNLTGCHKPLFHEADIYDDDNDKNKKDNDDNNNCHNDNNYLSFLRFALATRPLHGNLHTGSYFVSEYFSFVKF